MEYERYKKYFLARTFWYRYVGIALVALAVLMFSLGFFAHIFPLVPFAAFALVAGGIIGWVPSIGMADDKEILDVISRRTEGAIDKAKDETGLHTKFSENVPPVHVVGFVFDPENPYIRKGGDNHWRTSECVSTVILFAKLGVCAVCDSFSLSEEKSKHEIKELTFENFDGAHFEIEEEEITYNKKPEKARFSNLVFTLEGETVLKVPAERTSTIEVELEEIMRQRERVLREKRT